MQKKGLKIKINVKKKVNNSKKGLKIQKKGKNTKKG